MPLTNIQILRSAVPYKRPDVTFLLDGQLALNYKAEEPGLFTKLQNGDLIKIGPTAITTNGDFPNQNPDPTGVAGNSVAEKWFDQRAVFHSGVEKIWDGTQWNPVSGFTIDDATGDMQMLRTLGVDTLDANQVNINGGLDLAGNITPAGTSCVHDIGLAGQRWNNFFGCELDIQFDGQIGNDLQVLNDVAIGNDAAITGDIFVTGQQATFGQNCASGNFTVETPAFLNCDTAILGDLTVGAGITTVGDLDIGGSTRIGGGCGVSTFVVDADTTFNCPVTFSGSTFIFGTGCATSNIVWNGAMTQNCDLIPDPTSTVNLGSATNTYDSVFADNFEGGTFNGDDLVLSAKGISAATLDTDAPLTLTTKGWVEATIQNAVTASDEWERVNTNEIRSNVAGNHVVKNGTGSLGTSTNRWDDVFADNHVGVTLTLSGKATTTDSTVAADPAGTLTTKDYVDAEILAAQTAIDFWDLTGDDLSPQTAGQDIVKNGNGDIGDAASPWDNVFGSTFVGGSYSGSTLTLTGKGTSDSTLATDGGTTLTTKDYVDGLVAGANLFQRTGDDLSPVNAGDDFIMNGTGDIGSAGTPWDNIFGTNIAGGTLSGSSLTLTAKATSVATVAGDPTTTLTTKGYVDTLVSNSNLWVDTGTALTPKTVNHDVIPNGTADFGATGNRWANGFFNNVFTNDLHLKNERGDWTMIEEEDVLTLRNNKTGKRYAIMMTPYEG